MDFRKLRARKQSSKDDQASDTKADTSELAEDAALIDAEDGSGAITTPADEPDAEKFSHATAQTAATHDDDAGDEDKEQQPQFIQSLAEREDDSTENYLEILRFRMGGESFCLYLSEIEEIIKPRGFTSVPRLPDWILGIVGLRGTMVPVIDLALRLGITAESPGTQRIIIISHDNDLCGMLVDEVRNVELVDPEIVETIPAAISETAGRFLSGLIRVNGDLIAMIDIAAVLNLDEQSLKGAKRERTSG